MVPSITILVWMAPFVKIVKADNHNYVGISKAAEISFSVACFI